jgi:hypothetical protein
MEEHTLRLSKNKMLMIILGSKREELHNLSVSQNIIKVINSRRMIWEEHVARMGEIRNAYNILVGKPEGKRQLIRPSRRGEDNIRMDLKELG